MFLPGLFGILFCNHKPIHVMKKKLLFIAVFSLTATLGMAQTKTYWTQSSEPPLEKPLAARRAEPSAHQVFALDFSGFQQEVNKAPIRGLSAGRADLIVSFPDPQGTLKRYRVVEASVLHPDLAAKYPGIKSYAGQGLDEPAATIRFSVSNQTGFHGMVLSSDHDHQYYIDPYTEDRSLYTVYRRSDVTRETSFTCHTEETNAFSGRAPAPTPL